MNRRQFLRRSAGGILIASAPAICRAEWLMPVKVFPAVSGPFILTPAQADLTSTQFLLKAIIEDIHGVDKVFRLPGV